VPKEIELKLEVTADGSKALLASGLLGTESEVADLRAVYFDTPDHALRRDGIALRIREKAGKAVQTIKTGVAGAGLFDRNEWEIPVIGSEPVMDERTPVPALLEALTDQLMPVFEVRARRHTFTVAGEGHEIEAVVDDVEIVAGDRSLNFHEVELELVSGSADALFALARKIDAVAPLRISVLSKSGHGYALLDAQPEAVKAEKLKLLPGMDIPGAFAAIAGNCLSQYRRNETILLERRAPEAVHQARVGLRRLRSAMTLFKKVLVGPELGRLNARIRDLAQVLGEARDLDVLIEQAPPEPILAALTAAREAAYTALEQTLASSEARLLPLDLSEWVAGGSWRNEAETQVTTLRKFAAKALNRTRRKTRSHGRHLAEIDVEARHQLRKDAKKLRYAIEFSGPLFAKDGERRKRKTFARALRHLQEYLGMLNDRATAETRLASLGLGDTPEATAFLRTWDDDALLADAAKARHSLLDAKPFWR
jgi:inorganic triphosphatase YgiF